MLASVLLRLARVYGDDDLEERAVSALRLVVAGWSTARRASFGYALVAYRPATSVAARARSPSSATSASSEVARAVLAAASNRTR